MNNLFVKINNIVLNTIMFSFCSALYAVNSYENPWPQTIDEFEKFGDTAF